MLARSLPVSWGPPARALAPGGTARPRLDRVAPALAQLGTCAQVEVDGYRVAGRVALLGVRVHRQRLGDGGGRLVADHQKVGRPAIEAACPELEAVADAQQARRHAERVAAATHGPVDDDLYAELLADAPRVHVLPREARDERAGPHAQSACHAQRVDQILGQTFRDVVVVGLTAVPERQDRHGLGERRAPRGRAGRRARKSRRAASRRTRRYVAPAVPAPRARWRSMSTVREPPRRRRKSALPGFRPCSARRCRRALGDSSGLRLRTSGGSPWSRAMATTNGESPRRRQLAGEHLEQHHPERVDVGAGIDVGPSAAPARAPCTPACRPPPDRPSASRPSLPRARYRNP